RRIRSMAGTHALLSQSRWDGVDLAELVRRQLAPDGTDANTTIGGPNITLPVAATPALAMVLHELVTNAAKYGALSTPHGRVEVNWNHGPGEHVASLSIAWREIGGPAVAASPDCGYGIRIIRDLIPQELGGSVDLAFASSGVCCNIEIPLEPARHRHTGLSAGDARSREPVQP
ncbi:MAG: sensor histidine kinase, partial [Hyphomicrobiales bacterium]|nr:sensor histidine kinase [Hyphomicrobiales bacterium]